MAEDQVQALYVLLQSTMRCEMLDITADKAISAMHRVQYTDVMMIKESMGSQSKHLADKRHVKRSGGNESSKATEKEME